MSHDVNFTKTSIDDAPGSWRLSWSLGLCVIVLASLIVAPGARGADRIYWSNFDNNTISFANLNGEGGGGTLDTGDATVDGPMGLTIDPSRGLVYWTNWALDLGTTISYADLEGGGGGDLDIQGATIDGPHGLAIDPSVGPAGRLYWPNFADNSISYADLDGHGAGVGADLTITNATVDGPRGVTVDPVGGRLYWSNFSDGDGTTISYADLDGAGDGDLLEVGSTGEGPEGTAIDPVTRKIYWSDYGAWTQLAYANVDGTNVLGFNPGTATTVGVHGVAIDPTTRRLYWANYGDNSISSASLDGGDGQDLDTSGATVNGPNLPALLKSPVGTGVPQISGGSEPPVILSCSSGAWASDVIESLLYRAPHEFAYQWSLDGKDLPGAQTKSITARTDGSYRCRVTAQNAAGARSQTSTAHAVAKEVSEPPVPSNEFSFGKLKRDRHKGNARLAVELPGPGTLRMSSHKLKPIMKSPAAAGEVILAIRARGRAKKVLDRRGKVTVRPVVTFTPTGGGPNALPKSLKLIEKTKH